MDPTHIHLLINHLPVIGSLLGCLVLFYGIWTKSQPTLVAAYLVLLISAAGGGIAYFTGEPAEETVEKLAGINKAAIEVHEEAAKFAIWGFILMGAVSLVGLFISGRSVVTRGRYAIAVLIITLLSFGLAARTGYLGGKIRHTEVHGLQPAAGEGEAADDD
jgi:uncharacterized membrane protein